MISLVLWAVCLGTFPRRFTEGAAAQNLLEITIDTDLGHSRRLFQYNTSGSTRRNIRGGANCGAAFFALAGRLDGGPNIMYLARQNSLCWVFWITALAFALLALLATAAAGQSVGQRATASLPAASASTASPASASPSSAPKAADQLIKKVASIERAAGPSAALGFQLDRGAGSDIRVGEVDKGSPADKAGLRGGDQILSMDGRRVKSAAELIKALEQAESRKVQLLIVRNDYARHLTINPEQTGNSTSGGEPGEYHPRIGITMSENNSGRGVLIQSLLDGGPADDAGMQVGDRVLAVDGKRVTTPDEVQSAILQHQPGSEIDLRVSREGWRRNFFLILVDQSSLVGKAVKAAPPSPFGREPGRTFSSQPIPSGNAPPPTGGSQIIVIPSYSSPNAMPDVIRDPALRSVYTDFD